MGISIIKKLKNWGEKWNQKICRWVTPKALAAFLAIGYVISLIPLLWIAKYNYPSADDYTNGSRCYQVWKAGHSVFQVLAEALSRTMEEWMIWRGCFTSSFLSALPPNIWGEKMYFLTTWVVLLTLTLATLFFFYELLVKVMRADRYTSHSIAIVTLFISVQCMGMPGRTESFYWYSGAVNYTFIHGLSLFFYGMLISIACTVDKGRGLKVTIASLLGFFVAGGNQMTMLNGVIVLFGVIILLTVQKKWKDYKGLWIPIVTFYVGVIIAAVAPGNFIRASESSGMSPIKAIFVSFYYVLDLMVSKWTTWSLLILVICITPLFWHVAGSTRFKFPCPFFVILLGFCLVSAMATPPLFIMGNIDAGRIQGLIFLMYTIVLVLCVGYVVGWMHQKYEHMLSEKKKFDGKEFCRYGTYSCQGIAGGILFFMFGSVLFVIPEPHYYTVTSAIADIVNNSVVIYGEQLEERSKLYYDGAGKDVVVAPLLAQPELLFFLDIEKDQGDWKNQGICRYYGLDSVVVGEKTTIE